MQQMKGTDVGKTLQFPKLKSTAVLTALNFANLKSFTVTVNALQIGWATFNQCCIKFAQLTLF